MTNKDLELIRAWRTFGPRRKESDQRLLNKEKEAAALVLLGEIQKATISLRVKEDDRQDIAQNVLIAILKASPFDWPEEDKNGKKRIISYVYRVCRNCKYKMWRRNKNTDCVGEEHLEDRLEHAYGATGTPADELVRTKEMLRPMKTIKEKVIKPFKKKYPKRKNDIEVELDEMIKLARRECTADDLSGTVARNTIYKRHTRARKKLLVFLGYLQRKNILSADEVDEFKEFIKLLK